MEIAIIYLLGYLFNLVLIFIYNSLQKHQDYKLTIFEALGFASILWPLSCIFFIIAWLIDSGRYDKLNMWFKGE